MTRELAKLSGVMACYLSGDTRRRVAHRRVAQRGRRNNRIFCQRGTVERSCIIASVRQRGVSRTIRLSGEMRQRLRTLRQESTTVAN
ncbi:hypothetical protein [uncultured Mediterranean phage uvDeep-CGR2-KM19-C37]|nr:hypothetical protein [uncultured Mediterranean phage uvDeep-CGR2-KM19-C37]